MSVASRAVQRIGNPLNWHPADKCLFGAGIVTGFVVWYSLVLLYLWRRPLVAPYIDQAFLGPALKVQAGSILVWLCLIGVALKMRRGSSDCRILVLTTFLLYIAETCWGAHILGLHTSLFSGLPVLAGPVVAWTLFDRRQATWGTAVGILAVTALTAAEQTGLLSYAPLLATAPFREGYLAASWLAGIGGVAFVMMFATLALCYFIIDRWHDREVKLVATSDQLSRANDLISRYVASQLAEQIKEGKYDLLDRHARRRLTLFFSDIEDFAAVADRVEPEDLSEVLNDYLSEMTVIGKDHDATIDKFVGDAIMIFFGAPVATTDRDHAVRAVQMAIVMQEKMTELRAKWSAHGFGYPFHIRIGINTGQASIGNFGSRDRMDYTAIGRQVNLAARLQSHCKPDHILLSHSAWVLVKDRIPCVPRGEVQVKGFQQPVSVYEVERRAPRDEGSSSAEIE